MSDYENDPEEDDIAPGSSVFGDDASYASGASVFDTPDHSGTGDPEQQSAFTDPPANSSIDDDPWGDTSSEDAIPLDVEAPDSDDLDAWSVLGASSPQWNDPAPTEAGVDADPAWDPGPAPTSTEPETVKIGEPSERFFTYDDQGAGNAEEAFVATAGSGRDMQSAIITGVVLLAVALIALSISPIVALALIVLVVALAAGEFFNALRLAGYQPATLLGLAGSVALPLAVYWKGQQAVPLVLALSVIFALLWFLSGVSTDTPVMNIGVTLLGIVYIGLLGSFGASMLELGERFSDGAGRGLLLAAIIVAVSYDVGAFFAGRSFGRTPLSSASPNKTVEGLVGGAIACLIASVVVFGVLEVDPFGDTVRGGFVDAFLLGLVGAIAAPLGDLGESLLKRDLGIKDMGSILPGHGGFLDRFDALLFVLPAVYYLAETVLY